MAKITAKTTELIGEFSHEIVARGADDSPDRWLVGELRDGKKITGLAAKGKLQRGGQYRFLGSFVTHDTFGRQFKFTSFVACEPTSLDAIQRYLQKAKGIGPQAAARIVGEYGTSSLEACRERPVEVESKCGIPQTAMAELRETLIRGKRLEKVTMEVEELLHGRGFPRSLASKVIEKWGVLATDTIRENPYKLRMFHGVGFKTADALYQHLGLPMNAMIRQVQCVLHAIESDISGSTWVPKSAIADLMKKNIGGVRPKVEAAICQAVKEELIRERGEWFASAANADAESSFVSDVFSAMMETVSDDGF